MTPPPLSREEMIKALQHRVAVPSLVLGGDMLDKAALHYLTATCAGCRHWTPLVEHCERGWCDVNTSTFRVTTEDDMCKLHEPQESV